MNYVRSKNIKLAFMLAALLAAASANASLLDCIKLTGIESASNLECVTSEVTAKKSVETAQDDLPIELADKGLASFRVEHTATQDARPESALLLVLVVAVLASALVRTKSYNSK
jgi:hypothetical protein